MSEWPLISILTFTPLLGGVVALGLGDRRGEWARRTGLAFCAATLAIAVLIVLRFDPSVAGLQMIEEHPWIPSLAVDYFTGVDGLGLIMVVLTVLVTPMALLTVGRVEQSQALFVGLTLFLETGLLGTFTALNFFHWFLFWELSLVPAFFLIKLWGGPRRGPAATQFFVYTMVGSVAMLLAFAALYVATGRLSFPALAELGRNGEIPRALAERLGWLSASPETLGMMVFAGVLLGLAVKVPLMPLHTWLPTAYAEAPSGVTMLLTGLMSKMGVYGFLRILAPIFPEQMRAVLTPLLWLAVASIVLSAAAAFAQRDLKRMFAYSSINHLGYCLLGIFAAMRLTPAAPHDALERAAALNGVLLQMFNHGIIAATLFGLVAFLEVRSEGRRGIDDFGGLRQAAPVFCGLTGIAAFASLGLPGLSGFVGEFLIFKGVFPLVAWAAAAAALGLLITAVFLLTFLQRVFHGPLDERWRGFTDLTARERWIVGPAVGVMLVLGVYPQILLGVTNPTVVEWVRTLTS